MGWPGVPERLGARIVLALVLAAVAVVALDSGVAAWDRAHEPAPRRPAPAAGEVLPDADAVPAAADRALRVGLAPTPGTIAVARRLASLPPDIAPVVEILSAGELVLRRPPPLATGPGAPPRVSVEGHGAGVVLPAGTAGIAALTPAARGALLWLLQRWVQERPAAPARMVGVDLELPPRDVVALLRWLP